MPRKSNLISDALLSKCTTMMKHQDKSGVIARKLQAIISAKEHNVKKVSEIIGITRATLIKWIKDFEKESIDGLLVKKGRGRKAIFNAAHKAYIKESLLKDGNMTALKLKSILHKEFRINPGIATVYRAMKEVGFSYITPRKNHYNQDKKEVDEFKKN